MRERLGLSANHRLGIGIDRLDYTKGILERFNAVARLLEREPRWIGRFSFVQIAAPSRATIDDYRDYSARVHALAAEINGRYPNAKYPPIILIAEHHEPEAVYEYHRAADLCFVSQPARRDESGREGVRRCARRRAGRADPVAVRGRVARDARRRLSSIRMTPNNARQALNLALTMPEPSSAIGCESCVAWFASSTSTAGQDGCCSMPR